MSTTVNTEVAKAALTNIGKRYGAAWALQDVSLSLYPGECVALLGENGAGKSTIIRILSGVIEPTTGDLEVEGTPRRFRNPREALGAGIAVIPQELAYVPKLTVGENLVVGRWPQRGGYVSPRAIARIAEDLVQRYGFDFDVRRKMESLSLAERQIVEIVKVLARDARVILLDEPTASLSDAEAKRLLSILDDVKRDGRAVVYVSHRLDECFQVAERIMVLRNGRVAYEGRSDRTRSGEVVAAMLGRDGMKEFAPRQGLTNQSDDANLEVIDWRATAPPRLNGLSFTAASGEVVALFGLLGSGAETVARALGGHQRGVRGALKIGSEIFPPFQKPDAARRARVGYVPAERKSDGLALNRPVRDNLTLQILPRLSRFGLLRKRLERREVLELIETFRVSCRGETQQVGELSGGNQQKVLLAGRLASEPKVLVLHEPTRGVDIGARAQIHDTLVNFARRGATVVVVTSDVDEAVAVADRLLVVRDGVVAQELTGSAKTPPQALALATKAQDTSLEEAE